MKQSLEASFVAAQLEEDTTLGNSTYSIHDCANELKVIDIL